jgi:hypothetical protein
VISALKQQGGWIIVLEGPFDRSAAKVRLVGKRAGLEDLAAEPQKEGGSRWRSPLRRQVYADKLVARGEAESELLGRCG